MWKHVVEETRRRRTEEKVASAGEEGNAGKCGKKLLNSRARMGNWRGHPEKKERGKKAWEI